MQRSDVYKLIDGERDYQDCKWGNSLSSSRPGNGERTIDEFILYIFGYATELMNIGATMAEPEIKLSFVRKIGGLCVGCMEQHGAPPREAAVSAGKVGER